MQTSGSTGTGMVVISRVVVCILFYLLSDVLLTYAVDYNSWIESDKGRRLRASLDPNIVLAEGYKEYDTGRTYLVSMGDWRKNKDEEVQLDGIGGVNIVVKADVHRTGKAALYTERGQKKSKANNRRHQFPGLCIRKPGRNRGICSYGQASWVSGGRSAKLRGLAH